MTQLSSDSVIVNLEDVWFRFNEKWVLKSIYLTCKKGEILGIVGPNGGGKSTLLNIILGCLKPEKGKVLLFGKKPDKETRLEVGYLPQISHADRQFPVNVMDVVLMGLYNRLGLFSFPRKADRDHAMELLHQVDMANYANKSYQSLSGGQKQRVNIARALASNPKLLVLDEPSTGIDSIAQEHFYELLAKLRDEQGISVIMVTHDIGTVTSYADRVACLNREIHYHGEPNSCFTTELHHKVFGKDLKIMVHDSTCTTCYRKHQSHD